MFPLERCVRFSAQPHDYAMNLQAMTREKLRFMLPVAFTIEPAPTGNQRVRTDVDSLGGDDAAKTDSYGGDALMKYTMMMVQSGGNEGEWRTSLENITKGVTEGETSLLVSGMTMEELFAEREIFMRRLSRNVQSKLDHFGLRVHDTNLLTAVDDMTHEGRVMRDDHPYGDNTPAIVQQLIGLGAVVVGKCKMSEFSPPREPTDEWVDFNMPYKPRGDSYVSLDSNDPLESAKLEAYPWINASLGTSGAGRIKIRTRAQARWCGLGAASLLVTGAAAASNQGTGPGTGGHLLHNLAASGTATVSWISALVSIQIGDNDGVPIAVRIRYVFLRPPVAAPLFRLLQNDSISEGVDPDP